MKLPLLTRCSMLTVILLLLTFSALAQNPVSTNVVADEQKTAIEKIVREYLLSNPSVIREYLLKNPVIIREAMDALQVQETQQKQALAAENLKKLSTEIYFDKDSPTTGNPQGDVTVVAFFDYNCGYCKRSLPALQGLLAKDSSVKVIYKELPILGTESIFAAQAALAAKRQGKYEQFHQALLAADQANEETVKAVAKQLGLNYATLVKDMADPKLQQELNRNVQLATALDINGTPAYLVGDQIVPGAIDLNSLTKKIALQRAKIQKTNSVAETESNKTTENGSNKK